MKEERKRCTKCGEEKGLGEFNLRGYIQKNGVQSRSSWCKICISEYNKANKTRNADRMNEYYKKNPEKFRQRSRDWRKKNPEKALTISRKCHEKKDRFVIALQSSQRAAKNGNYESCNATLEEVRAAWTGLCAICGVPSQECTSKFHMDHDYESGEFRGWLCSSCNKGLGFLKDSEELLINALHFLMNSKQKQKQ